MKQEYKEFLLKDLCARLPYGLKVQIANNDYNAIGVTRYPSDEGERVWCVKTDVSEPIEIEYVKPYLRPLSSMTEEERETYLLFSYARCNDKAFDWLNAHYFDYRGLIGKGLALEAPKGMY